MGEDKLEILSKMLEDLKKEKAESARLEQLRDIVETLKEVRKNSQSVTSNSLLRDYLDYIITEKIATRVGGEGDDIDLNSLLKLAVAQSLIRSSFMQQSAFGGLNDSLVLAMLLSGRDTKEIKEVIDKMNELRQEQVKQVQDLQNQIVKMQKDKEREELIKMFKESLDKQKQDYEKRIEELQNTIYSLQSQLQSATQQPDLVSQVKKLKKAVEDLRTISTELGVTPPPKIVDEGGKIDWNVLISEMSKTISNIAKAVAEAKKAQPAQIQPMPLPEQPQPQAIPQAQSSGVVELPPEQPQPASRASVEITAKPEAPKEQVTESPKQQVEQPPSEPMKVSESVPEQPQPTTKDEDVIEIDLGKEAEELAKSLEER